MMELFTNDMYKLLKLLYDNQTIVLEKKVVPLSQIEIGEQLKMSKAKVNSLFVDLQKNGLVIQEKRGKYRLSDNAEIIICSINSLENMITK
mgnify:CR=1 FL=1